MPSFRFCRTDDLQLLTDALNTCYAPHFPGHPELSAAEFKREIKELDVWSSSCMVALGDRGPIAVVTGAKRDEEGETLIHRIGVHPEFQRRGHAQHMLDSLSQKLAVLGPPLMVAEVPTDLPAVRDLFLACGYKAEGSFADFTLEAPLAPPAAAGMVAPATYEDLVRADALTPPATPRSWERAAKTLQNLEDQLQGFVVASDRVEAYVLYRDLPEESRREIVALGTASENGRGRVFLEILIRVASQAGSLTVTIPKVSPDEVSYEVLDSLGFRRQREYTRYTAISSSGL